MSDYLPEELVVQIFRKLPVKSLLRFRSLSKSWCSLISSPDFIRNHTLGLVKTTQKVIIMSSINGTKDIYTLHQEDQLPMYSSEAYSGVTSVELPTFHHQIAGSCNGILCLVSMSLNIFLWNFSVRRQLMIPSHPLRSISDMIVGFGHDPITNDYKILTIDFGVQFTVFLYSVNTACWSAIAPPATMFYFVRCEAYLVNKMLHWVASESPGTPHHVIITFDLSTHVFGKISLPEPSWEPKHLAAFNGSLAVMCTKGNDLCIWVKTESNDVPSWSVFLKLESPEFRAGRILQPTFNGDLLIHTFPDPKTDWDYKVYNTRTGVLLTLSRFRAYCDIYMETYVESLELLDKGTPYGDSIKWTEKIFNPWKK